MPDLTAVASGDMDEEEDMLLRVNVGHTHCHLYRSGRSIRSDPHRDRRLSLSPFVRASITMDPRVLSRLVGAPSLSVETSALNMQITGTCVIRLQYMLVYMLVYILVY